MPPSSSPPQAQVSERRQNSICDQHFVRAVVAGVGNQGIGLTNARGQRQCRQQGPLKNPRQPSVSSLTPTAVPTGRGEGEDPQQALQAEKAGAGATDQQADLVALHLFSALAPAGEVDLLLQIMQAACF